MARPEHRIIDFAGFTATREWRFALTVAVISFLLFHGLAMATPATNHDLPLDQASFERQMLHFIAVFLRFTLPFACMMAAFGVYIKQRRASRPGGRGPG
jgi:hypothetical protein